MTINPSAGFPRLASALCVCAALTACGHSAPSESDAKQLVANGLGGCQYFRLRDFTKVNGIPGDTGNDYRVEVRYTVRLTPDGAVKDYVRQWNAQNEKYESMKADADRKANDYYSKKQKYVDAHPNDIQPEVTFEQQHQDTYQPMINEKIAVGNLASQLNLNSPARFFMSRITQACPGMSYQFPGKFFKGPPVALVDDVDVDFTQTLDMIRTDNGWQATR